MPGRIDTRANTKTGKKPHRPFLCSTSVLFMQTMNVWLKDMEALQVWCTSFSNPWNLVTPPGGTPSPQKQQSNAKRVVAGNFHAC